MAAVILPEEYRLVPCPSCGLTGNHTGLCRYGVMRTGKSVFFVGYMVVEDFQPSRDTQLETAAAPPEQERG